AAAWIYLDFDKRRDSATYWGAFALFVLGLLSKSVIASLPAALLLVFWWQRGTLSWRRDWVPLLPYFAVGAVAGLATAWLERTQVG
ncbi:MAG TPA: O-GlcNAc transferase, partial [Lacipirellulaceae bacterium]|nr:O-GlcNAc transferase [Lacipirellulaceae bacterium]